MMVEPPASEMLLKLYCAAGEFPTSARLTPARSDTFGSVTVDPCPLTVIVLPLSEQFVPRVNPSAAQAPVAELMFPGLVVGGAGDGSCGAGYETFPDNCTTLPATVALPVSVNASTALAVHVPTPVRGVYRFPCTSTWPPIVRFPFVPTLPPLADSVGEPEAAFMVDES